MVKSLDTHNVETNNWIYINSYFSVLYDSFALVNAVVYKNLLATHKILLHAKPDLRNPIHHSTKGNLSHFYHIVYLFYMTIMYRFPHLIY